VRADSTKITEVGVTPVPMWQRKQLPAFQSKEPSVSVRSDSPLEHQLRNTPTARTGLAGMSGWVRSPLRRLRSVALQFIQLTWKQPSPTADLAVISR